MHIHNLHEDESGISHFRDLDIPWESNTLNGRMSARLPAHRTIFRQPKGAKTSTGTRAATARHHQPLCRGKDPRTPVRDRHPRAPARRFAACQPVCLRMTYRDLLVSLPLVYLAGET